MKFNFKKDGLEGKELAFANALEASMNASAEEAFKGLVDQKALDARIATIQASIIGKGLTEEEHTQFKEMIESVKQQAIALSKIKDKGVEPDSPLKQSIAAQIKAFIVANPDKWEAFKSHEQMSFGVTKTKSADGKSDEIAPGINLTFYTKAAGTMSVGASTGGSAFVPNVEMVPGLVPRPPALLVLCGSRRPTRRDRPV